MCYFGDFFFLKLWKLFLCSGHEYFGGYVVNTSSLVVHLKLPLIPLFRTRILNFIIVNFIDCFFSGLFNKSFPFSKA